ncbi:helix-turn-helix domain-containing protein [Flexivirga alba]|uniref:Helix-turn-helix domain-containing protein n=1 Tax=Flexivirga alba TaxID=702742 RepID=A0ABW2AE55_9MICO
MYEELGRAIRAGREGNGLEQAELAGKLGVGQQAVSRWERGGSRPRRTMLPALAEALGVQEGGLLKAGGYLASRSPAPPQRPLSRVLPFDELPPERFEDLVADLMAAMYPEGHASRYGGPGEKQFGIDVLVTGSKKRHLATAQCKRHLTFGPAAVKEAVAEVTIDADAHHLFLSRQAATPATRNAMASFSGWTLHDGEDISRYIRNLQPLDRAVRLVDTYFPMHREAFLGVPQPGPWLLAEEAFDLGSSQLFNHNWRLVGRDDELRALIGLLHEQQCSLAGLVGPGGIGKSRMLRAIAEATPDDAEVRVLLPGTGVTGADLELLPAAGRLVVLIEDAHDRDDIAEIVSGIQRRNGDAGILLVSRPYGWDRLKTDLTRSALWPDDVRIVSLADLPAEAAEALALEALSDDFGALSRRLASATLDCPLVTVLGGSLIQRGQLDPSQLEQADSVRDAILGRFSEALVADPLVTDPETRQGVLYAIAAFQPFRTNEEAFRNALSAVVGKPFDVLQPHLRSLEDAGVLRRRGAALRIVPDLLGDVLLARASFDKRSTSETGYLRRVQDAADGQVAQHLFINASRVDWQVRRQVEGTLSLIDQLWSQFEAEMREGDIVDRENLLKLLKRIAYFQADRALALCRWLIDNPTDRLEDEHAARSFYRAPTYFDVLREIPPVLKLAAFNFEALEGAIDQLWELAQIDDRPAKQYPNHALRVLRDLAEFGVGKPLAYLDAVVDIMQRNFTNDQRVSPFEVLEPMLATEGSDSSYSRHTISFRPFPLNTAVVGPLRERLIDLAFTEARSDNLARAVAAVDFLESALRYPHGMYGRPVTDEEIARWTPEFVRTIERLSELAGDIALDPVVGVWIRGALHWHASYCTTATNAPANAAIDALPNTIEHRLALAMHDGWGRLVRDRGDDYAAMESKRERVVNEIVTELSSRSDEEVLRLVQIRLAAERAGFGAEKGHPGTVVAALVNARPTLAKGLLDQISSHKAPSLEPLLPVVLSAYAEHDPSAALDVARVLLANGPSDLAAGVTQALSWNRGRRSLAEGELDLLMRLAQSADATQRDAAVRAAQIFARDNTAAAVRILAGVRFADNPRLADDVFMCIGRDQFDVSWEHFSTAELKRIREDLVALPDLGGYSVTHALAERSRTNPGWVIELLQDRVTYAESATEIADYRAMPFSWDNALHIRESAEFQSHLRKILAWIGDGADSYARNEGGGEVFKVVAGTYDDTVLEVLAEPFGSGTRRDLEAVAAVLRKAESDFIWKHSDFVVQALHAAEVHDEELLRTMSSTLYGATISGTRVGTPGKPYQEDIDQRDECLAIANRLPRNSTAERFFRDMVASAEAGIARSSERDLGGDNREW